MIKVPSIKRQEVWCTYIGKTIGETKCLCCNFNNISPFDFVVGHIIPKSKGGLMSLDNLRPICSKCNSSMSNMHMLEFMEKYHYDITRINIKDKSVEDNIKITGIMRNNFYEKTKNVFENIIENKVILCPYGGSKKRVDLFNENKLNNKKYSKIFINYNIGDYIIIFDRDYDYSLVVQITSEVKTKRFDNYFVVRTNNCEHIPYNYECKTCDESVIMWFSQTYFENNPKEFIKYLTEEYRFENYYSIYRDIEVINIINKDNELYKKYNTFPGSICQLNDNFLDKHKWTYEENFIISVCYLQNKTIDFILTLLPTIKINSIKMKYNNCLYLDKNEGLNNFTKQHKEIFDLLKSVSWWYIKIACNDINFDKHEAYLLETKSVGIGFSIKDKELIKNDSELLKEQCDKYATRKKDYSNYNTFINKIKINDIVFLCKGEDTILYVSQIASDYYFDNTNKLCHRRKLKNIFQFNDTANKRMIETIYNL